MSERSKVAARGCRIALALLLCAGVAGAQQRPGAAQRQSLRGQVSDQSGGVIVGAAVTAVPESGIEKTTTANAEGVYAFSDLAPGRYTVRATAPGFAVFEKASVQIAAGRPMVLDIRLLVTLEKQKVEVSADAPLSVDAENNAGAIVLKGKDLDTLPDDPDALADALQALAGPSAGPNGGQFFIDGFTGSRLPPKDAIREIRINQNPFASEHDRLGFGRIEIFTRPGMDKFHGGTSFNFNDESLNSRNPFAANRAPFQSRLFGGHLSGPISKDRASFFLAFQRREIDDNAVIHATILDSGLNVVPFNQAVLTPHRFAEMAPRLDFKLNQNHTLVAGYTYEHSASDNAGIGDLSLPSRAYDRSNTEQILRLTETAVLSAKVVNETRFQYIRERRSDTGDNTIATLQVLGAFTGGGPQVGRSFNHNDRWELQNYTTRASGKHTIKFGVRLRGGQQEDASPNNFGGMYLFGGGFGPQLDADNRVVRGQDGQPVRISMTSLERYRRTLLFQRQGLSPAEIRALGGGATQFAISGGDPLADVSQVDFGGFLQDDWRLRSNLTLSGGLRYEAQNNIGSHRNFAPRLAFAWSPRPGSSRQPKTVIRGGFGIFYDRFSEGLTLQARRFNGVRQQQFVVSDPAVLDLFPAVPSVERLAAFAAPQTIRQVASDLRAPYSLTSSISLERQLPKNFTVSASYVATRALHVLRSRNINAPLPGTVTASNRNGVRPLAYPGNIDEFESGGILNQQQLILNSFNRLSRKLTLFGAVIVSKANSDTDGVGTFPADMFDLRGEYGRSALDVRSRVFLGGSITLPRGITLNPFVVARTGGPFNITAGVDNNGDLQFTDRPSLATDLSRPSAIVTRFGAFDTNPGPGQATIPRNYGQGPGYFSINLRLSKTFALGRRSDAAALASATPQGTRGGPVMIGGPRGGGGEHGGGGGRGGERGGGFGGGPFGGGASDSRYSLTFSIAAQNLLNHTNPANPIGNLTSPLFGQSTGISGGGFGGGGGGPNSAAGNRRIDLQLRFNF